MNPALRTIGLGKSFGGFKANADVSLSVKQGARHALIGPNGAGKTTFINLLTGVLPPSAGTIWLNGEDVTYASQQGRVRRGMARTYQINQLFAELTPIETVSLAIAERQGTGARFWSRVGADSAVIDEAEALLTRMQLGAMMTRRTSTLPYGKQRLLEIALAMACKPKLLLLDEPAAGVPEDERHDVLDSVAALPEDVTVLLIEHDMELVFSFADRISVLVQGALFAEGTVDEISSDPRVKAVYLGEDAHV
ncbi:ABC transporter ATP-binding protein [Bosea caraganae]|uniref:ABC transporter ATP-binding protein n=1 Tax=Bosea caraganae TaxID=2763117 RepID=A0A370L1M0_9HYPH|nr:ABC transporter ATP-binding protein [Bosea caraganae]RDJ21450.1 ABC transporter ATP-binding protein [Bosea caraganae]RDJ23418.1 ABC transporter ATP-binding protein [Bosea caraganae]